MIKTEKRYSTWIFGGLGFVLMTSGLTGCVTARRADEPAAAKIAKLESRLRIAQAEIETLRERNQILKSKIKIVRENGGEDPQLASQTLAAFRQGVQTDVPISPSNGSSSARRAKRLPEKRVAASTVESVAPAPSAMTSNVTSPAAPAAAPSVAIGEQADRVLARTVEELLKSGNELEAERTAALLEKSYPDSSLAAETRFQQGLYFFRKKNLPHADRLFQMTLKSPQAHVRARAGAALMRGVIARQVASEGQAAGRSSSVARSNIELSRKSFEYVRKQFPGSPEAKRADRELRALNAMASRVK